MASVAVVGAGIAGISAARTLQRDGFTVTMFDRGRRLGGRSCSRQAGGGYDHGAQYFTVDDARFERAVAPLCRSGVVAPWAGRVIRFADEGRERRVSKQRYVGVPGMGSFVEALAAPLDVTLDTRVAAAEESASGWSLTDADGSELGEYDVLLLAMPPEQARALVPRGCALLETLAPYRSVPCWAAMLEFDARAALAFDGAEFDRHDIAWAARDSSKPGRGPGERWVIHAAAAWSRERFGAEPDLVADELAAIFLDVTGIQVPRPVATAHRWGFARVEDGPRPGAFWDDDLRLGVCGDWCVAPHIEGAWLSGLEAARTIGTRVGRPRRQRRKNAASDVIAGMPTA